MKPFTARLIPALVLLQAVYSAVPCSLAHASSDTHFFNISNEWNDRFRYLGAREVSQPGGDEGLLKGAASSKVQGPAAKYFEKKDDVESAHRQYLEPPPETITLAELRQFQEKIIEIKLNQVLVVNGRGIEKYLSTTPDIVEFYKAGGGVLQIKGINIGSTYVHIWDETGRSTYQIRVVRPPYVPTREERKYEEALEGGESFKLDYHLARSSFYEGNAFRDLDERTVTFNQDFLLTGDSPYGHVESGVSLRRLEDVTNAELSEIFLHLEDAKIGDFRHFDLNIADDTVSPGLLILPSVRLRGVNIDYEDPAGRTAYTVFFGRELTSFLGTLSPSAQGTEDIDSFLGGFYYDHKLSPTADWRLSYIQGYGQQRADTLNRRALEFVQRYKLSPRLEFVSDIGYDNEKLASQNGLEYRTDTLKMDMKYRDISKKFFTMIGNPADQGEQGVRYNLLFKPNDRIEVIYDVDAYRDRLFPALGESDRYNTDQTGEINYNVSSHGRLNLQAQRKDETGRVSPLRDEMYGIGYTHGFRFWNRNMSAFVRLQDRDFESLNNQILNYRSDTLITGFNTMLFFDIFFGIENQVTYLEETELRQITHPRVTTYSLTNSRQIGKTPFYTDLSIRFRDEEEAESERSFLAGEDRLEFSGSLRYRIDNMEFFLDGRYDSITAEALGVEENQRSEAEVNTGMRYLFDSNVYWKASGTFEGYVFNDANNDGVKQAEETGLENLVVVVGDNEIRTGAGGYFKSPVVSGKSAVIALDPGSIPSGYAPTTPLKKTLPVEERRSGRADFGLVTKSSIVGYVYNDINGNGRYDREDKGIPEVRVTLDGKEVQKTDVRGRYYYGNAVTGAHRVKVDLTSLPTGYLPQTPLEKDLELFEGVTYETHFQIVAERTLSGRVFIDANGNGILDGGEKGAANASVHFGPQSAMSDAEGYYLFDKILPGEYTLTVDPSSVLPHKAVFARALEFTSEPETFKIDIAVQSGE